MLIWDVLVLSMGIMVGCAFFNISIHTAMVGMQLIGCGREEESRRLRKRVISGLSWQAGLCVVALAFLRIYEAPSQGMVIPPATAVGFLIVFGGIIFFGMWCLTMGRLGLMR